MNSPARKTSAAPSNSPSQEGYATGRDGTRVYFRVRGPRTSPAVVLSDGIGCIGYIWKYLEAALLAQGWRVLDWHYRGHGKTPPPRDENKVAITDLADDLVAVLDAAGEEQVILVGYSMGAQVSLEGLRRLGPRVRGLILLSGGYRSPVHTFRRSTALERILPRVRRFIVKAPRLSRALWRNLLPTELAFQVAKVVEIDPKLVRREDFFPYLEGIAEVSPALFVDMLSAAAKHSAEDLLPSIEIPTLVIAGDRDGFTPVDVSRKMAAQIPGAKLVVVEGGTHTLAIERPAIVTSTVLDFLERGQATFVEK